jgi:hypothetical protein
MDSEQLNPRHKRGEDRPRLPKKLLGACQASEKPTFDIEDLKAVGFDYYDKQFEFHMMILTDQGFIEQDDGDPGFGLTKSMDGHLSWSVLPLRLTASGHQFIEALSNKEVWAVAAWNRPNGRRCCTRRSMALV